MDQSSIDHVKGVIEALLFVNERPVTFQQIKDILKEVDSNEIRTAIDTLKDEHDTRKSGVTIVEIAGGYQMLTNSVYASYVRSFYKTKHKEKLSKPALETLAIVAYKQPVTRVDIEMIRGVNSDGVVAHLLNKELVKVVGRKDVPGRPYLYGTTKQFQEYFGLKSLSDLPEIEDFAKLEPVEEAAEPSAEAEQSQDTEAPQEETEQPAAAEAETKDESQEETSQQEEEVTLANLASKLKEQDDKNRESETKEQKESEPLNEPNLHEALEEVEKEMTSEENVVSEKISSSNLNENKQGNNSESI